MEEIKEPNQPRFWHELYIEKEADPTDHRTDTQFCAEMVIDYSTLRAWKTKYRSFIYREVEAKRRNYRNEMRSRIYKALDKKLASDTNAIKLLAQLLGDLVEKTEVKTESMNDADKIRRIKTLSEANSKKQKAWELAEALKDSSSESKDGPLAQEPGRVDEKPVD